MSEKQLPTAIELDAATCQYLAAVIARDVRSWDVMRNTSLTREQALGLCMFLTDQLEPSTQLGIYVPSISGAAA